MSKAFVDTTILCDALGLSSVDRKKVAEQALAQFQITEAPFYGLKELKAGPLSSWILAYNILAGQNTIAEAMVRIGRTTAFRPRQNSVASSAIISGLLSVIESLKKSTNPKDYDEKAELENYLRRIIFKAWLKRRSVVGKVVQPLPCFVDSDLILDGNQIRFAGVSGSDCSKGASCGAAIELKKHPEEIKTIVDALRPPKTKAGSEKREITRRRAALKEVLNRTSKDFPRKDCRALGDAYFCIMSPADSEILTTNATDFVPMANALNKVLTVPALATSQAPDSVPVLPAS